MPKEEDIMIKYAKKEANRIIKGGKLNDTDELEGLIAALSQESVSKDAEAIALHSKLLEIKKGHPQTSNLSPQPRQENSRGTHERSELDPIFITGGIISGLTFIGSGIYMICIRSNMAVSTGTDTIMERSYHGIGWGLIGMGVFAASLLIGLAFRSKWH